jgi:hypothetical protein
MCLAMAMALALPWPGLRWSEPHPWFSSLVRLFEHDRGSGRVRVDQMRVALAMMRDHPWRAAGPGGWEDAASEEGHVVPGGHAAGWVSRSPCWRLPCGRGSEPSARPRLRAGSIRPASPSGLPPSS